VEVIRANVYQNLERSFGLQKASMMQKGAVRQGKSRIKAGATKVVRIRKHGIA
jgi:hypothetical protein